VRRVHDELVRGEHGPLQVPDRPLRGVELREHVRHDGRALVRRVGARRAALGGQPQVLREALAPPAGPPTCQNSDADARRPPRQRLPLPHRAGPRAVHDAPARAGAVALRQLPRRGPLGPQAEEQRILAQGGLRLAEEVRPARRALSGALYHPWEVVMRYLSLMLCLGGAALLAGCAPKETKPSPDEVAPDLPRVTLEVKGMK